jgi:DNA-binding MarR family transcriptional regulator
MSGINIEEKLGLSWLSAPSAPASADAPAAAPAAALTPADATLAVVGKQILGVLKESPNNAEFVHNLVDRLKLNIRTILSVVDWLETAGFVSVKRDQYANDSLKLTEPGRAWLS